jgi:GNAT superfamily N-acetyltransferase
MRRAIAIRSVVFIDEQHLTDNVDRDPYDQGAGAVVVLAYLDGEPVGTGRLHVWRGQGQIAWVAVLRPYRGRGVGREIMEALLDAAADLGAERVTLSAQTHAIEFYRLLGGGLRDANWDGSLRPAARLAVLPGLTGWSQVHGRDEIGWPERIEQDIWYIDHWSLRLDLEILAKTFGQLFRPEPQPVEDRMNIERMRAAARGDDADERADPRLAR